MRVKRGIDIAVSAAVLIFGLPLFTILALAILFESGRPVLYRQWRVGRNFKKFKLYKFRSMTAGSQGASITTANDRRITKLGRILRLTKLDELPQFWNVLSGDMSLVGPRPEVSEYVELFRERYKHVLTLRPGITDLASVQFRDEERVLATATDPLREYVERILPTKLDRAEEYIKRRSLWLDLSILYQTAVATLRVPGNSPEQMIARALTHFERMHWLHRPLVWFAQIAIFGACGTGAFLLRFDFEIPRWESDHFAWALSVWLSVKPIIFRLARLDRCWWRFVSVRDIIGIALGNLFASAATAVPIRLLAPPGFPRSIFVLDFVLCFLAVAGLRVMIRMALETAALGSKIGPTKRTLIYGAGGAGIALLQEIRRNRCLSYAVVGFVDDNPQKLGRSIHGARVLGDGAQLAMLATRHAIEMVLIAIPSASGIEMTQILHHCHSAGISHKTVPGLGEIIENSSLIRQIRDVAVTDLLGRSPAHLDRELICARYEGQVVLVTGAAGSIGSELCRQIARFQPRLIVGLDIGETALFHLEREMRQLFYAVPFSPVVGSVQDPLRVGEVLRRHSPMAVFHAAAYKHVPMMETHIFEAVKNNVFGTLNVAILASQYGVQDFVMISTDKAVHPTSIMGVTKRVAEIAVTALQDGRTKNVCVRFGNVLGSNGSVVSIFKQQIAAGGPVTVTHPEMRRYFMTIPEAAQLVLQASTIGTGGEILVLEMGEPVRIVDLARNLILLSGFRPEKDIAIEFTGVRPGEKLFEELNGYDEQIRPTHHEKIKVFTGQSIATSELRLHLQALGEICEAQDVGRLLLELKEIVPDYNPSHHVLRRAVEDAKLEATQHPNPPRTLFTLAAAGQ
jgi:FlaA1/EpsC-like NDP-sugar epimerase/lipopolysaccharide/colanic/teichoic acid biosynthesis glycosyltransferase